MLLVDKQRVPRFRMSTNTVKCMTCRGNKELAGMGGIIKECWNCKGKGRVPEPKVETSTVTNAVVLDIAAKATDEIISAVKAKNKRKSRAKAKEPVTADMFQDTCTLAAIFPDMNLMEAAASIAIDKGAKQTLPPKVDPLMQAILDEPRMTPEQWQAKYKHVERLFGINPVTNKFDELISKVQRAAMRADYAAQQPKVKRKVDVNASQDAAAEGDANYIAFRNKEAQANAS